MATYKGTAATAGSQAQDLHAGTVTRKSTYTFSVTASIGDVIEMVKVPSGAIITDVVLYSVGGDHMRVGDGVSVARFLASASDTSVLHTLHKEGVSTAIGYEYSLSSSDAVQHETIDCTLVTAVSSVGESVTLVVQYYTT